jgi:hypothetical protein
MLPTGTGDGSSRQQPRWKHRVALWTLALAALAGVIIGAGALWTALSGRGPRTAACRVTAGTTQYAIDPQQAANATTITAVGKQLGLPDHAVTIALATALQESQLHNLAYGDRDSLGLFQQRPSQGWGSPAQLMSPTYAATAFFNALARVPDWQTRSITSAAQAVQRSNAPQAYAQWEPLARTLAIATTGEVPAGLSCEFSLTHSTLPPASPAPAMSEQLGTATLGAPVAPARGWTIASWLVAHAQQYRIESVRFGKQEWTPKGAWNPSPTTATGVQISQAPAGSV